VCFSVALAFEYFPYFWRFMGLKKLTSVEVHKIYNAKQNDAPASAGNRRINNEHNIAVRPSIRPEMLPDETMWTNILKWWEGRLTMSPKFLFLQNARERSRCVKTRIGHSGDCWILIRIKNRAWPLSRS